jgi:hypothetical protein
LIGTRLPNAGQAATQEHHAAYKPLIYIFGGIIYGFEIVKFIQIIKKFLY